MVLALVRPHKDQVGQNLIIFVRILDLTYAQTVVICIIYQTYKYHESVHIIYKMSLSSSFNPSSLLSSISSPIS